MNAMDVSFVKLTHPVGNSKMFVRADKVVIVEEVGDGGSLVCMGEESVVCKESVEEVLRLIYDALCLQPKI